MQYSRDFLLERTHTYVYIRYCFGQCHDIFADTGRELQEPASYEKGSNSGTYVPMYWICCLCIY